MNTEFINKIISCSVKGFNLYELDGRYWVASPENKQWVITYYFKTNYLWYNFHFFDNIFQYMSLNVVKNDNLICDWVVSTFNVEYPKQFHPDYVLGMYDWSGQFNSVKVVEMGNIIKSL